jgi:predicted DNA-binding transcriptional regulator AlpA
MLQPSEYPQNHSGGFFMSTPKPTLTPGTIPSTGYLRIRQILSIFPICSSTWWDGCKEGRFPRPIKLGPRTTVWKAEDIRAFIDSLNNQNA